MKNLLNEVRHFQKIAGILKEDRFYAPTYLLQVLGSQEAVDNLIKQFEDDHASIEDPEGDNARDYLLSIDNPEELMGVVKDYIDLSEMELGLKPDQLEEDDDDSLDSDEYSDENLSKGERVALTRGFQLLTKSQMAGLFLKALEKHEDANGKYLNMVPGLRNWGRINGRGEFTIPVVSLAKALNVDSPYTAVRTVNKFRNIFKGIGSQEDEHLYPKIIKAAEQFKNQNPKDLAFQAGDAITSVPDIKGSLDVDTKQNRLKIGQKVHSLASSLMQIPKFAHRESAVRAAIAKISSEEARGEQMVAKAYQEFLKSKR